VFNIYYRVKTYKSAYKELIWREVGSC